jgi:glycosyltransferase involved in cell wall biosynthesis
MIWANEIKSGDVLFFFDLWFPGIEMLSYIRDGAGVDFKIAGIIHAGVYDKWDFLAQKNMTKWGALFEKTMLQIADLVFVSCEFHKDLIEQMHGAHENMVVQFLPIYLSEIAESGKGVVKQRQQVVFPHRLVPEKQPEKFLALKKQVDVASAVYHRSQDVLRDKSSYYRLLAESTIAVSFALQETWGIAMLEAAALGAIPLVPDRLAYADFYPRRFRYESEAILQAKIRTLLLDDWMLKSYREELREFVDDMDLRGRTSIGRMMNKIKDKFEV